MEKRIYLFRVISDNNGDKVIADCIKSLIRKAGYTNNIIEISAKQRVTIDLIDEMNKEGKFIILGGSGLFVNHYLDSLFYWNFDIDKYLPKIEVPICVFGVGHNNNFKYTNYGELQKDTINNIKKLCDNSKFVLVRDENTKNILKNNNIESINNGCPAFLSSSLFDSSNITKTIGLSFGKHGTYVKSYYNYIENFYYKIIIEMSKEPGIRFKLFVHDNKDSSYQTFLELFDRSILSKVSVVNYENTSKFIKEYSKLFYNIGLYLHSNIISHSFGVPISVIGYDVKSESFYNDFVEDKYSSYQMLDENLNYSLVINKIKKVLVDDYYNVIPKIYNMSYNKKVKLEQNFLNKLNSLEA